MEDQLLILRLDREESVATKGFADKLTWGDVYVRRDYFSCSLEDEVREIYGRHVSEWKLPKRTAIGAGVFRLGMEDSLKFGDDTITIYEVPGFDKIRMHGGVDIDDTEGCPLVGSRQDRENGTLHGAKVAQKFGAVLVPPVLAELKRIVRQALNDREKCWIQVRNAAAWYLASGVPVPKAIA
jgi:hypothetical protein